MKSTHIANDILISYGLVPIYSKEEIEKEIENYYKRENYSHMGFKEHMLDFIVWDKKYNGVFIKDIKLLMEKLEIKSVWGEQEIWFSKLLSVEYENISGEYIMSDNLSSEKVLEMGLKSPYLLSYLATGRSEDFIEEYKVKSLFEPKAAIKMVWVPIDRKLTFMQREIEEKGKFYKLKRELNEVFEQIEKLN